MKVKFFLKEDGRNFQNIDATRQSDLFKEMVRIFSVITGRSSNPFTTYKDKDLLLQSLLMHGLNYGDVSDAKLLKHDMLIEEMLGRIGSPSTLCRHFEEIAKGCRFLRGEVERPDYSHLPKYDKQRIGSVFFDTVNDTLLRHKLQRMKQEYIYLNGVNQTQAISVDAESHKERTANGNYPVG